MTDSTERDPDMFSSLLERKYPVFGVLYSDGTINGFPNYQRAVVAASSPKKASRLLKEYLDRHHKNHDNKFEINNPSRPFPLVSLECVLFPIFD